MRSISAPIARIEHVKHVATTRMTGCRAHIDVSIRHHCALAMP